MIFDLFKKDLSFQDKSIIMPPRQEPQPPILEPEKIIETNNFIAYFKNGYLYDVKPFDKRYSLDENRGIAYKARYIVSNGRKCDLENEEDIKSLVIPDFEKGGSMPYTTFDLSYILKMRVGVENRPSLAVPLAYKTASLMIASPIGWGKKDYYYLITHLWGIGEIKYGDYLLEILKKKLPFMAVNDELKHYYIQSINNQLEDDRTIFEKEKYTEVQKRREIRKRQELNRYDRDTIISKYKSKLEYLKVKETLGEKAPKSYSAYMRAKKKNAEVSK